MYLAHLTAWHTGRRGLGGVLEPHKMLAVYVEHYNIARPHRGINLGLPAADGEPAPASLAEIRRIGRVHHRRGP